MGIGNFGNYNFVKVKKQKRLADWLSRFLKESFDIRYETEEHTHKGNKIIYYKRNVEKFVDYHEIITRHYPRIDIFYGKDSIFIILICNPKERNKFIKVLQKISKFKFQKPKHQKGRIRIA